MTGFTDRVSRGILDHITGKAAIFTMPTAYIGLFTGAGSDRGGRLELRRWYDAQLDLELDDPRLCNRVG
jgi:hypothetical protein